MTNDFDLYFPSLKSTFARSMFILLTSAAVCLGAEFGEGGKDRSLAGSRPNIVLIIADDPAHRDMLEKLRATMDSWMKQTGDTIPPEDRRTPDRHDRITGERRFKGAHPGPDRYEPPGQSANATAINQPGPR